ncbi:MAG: hypothetical protein M0Z66_14085 [Thermaerobacter sp.]|nr:hypothetical protein [Thermaerobacter sp.]
MYVRLPGGAFQEIRLPRVISPYDFSQVRRPTAGGSGATSPGQKRFNRVDGLPDLGERNLLLEVRAQPDEDVLGPARDQTDAASSPAPSGRPLHPMAKEKNP